MSCLELDRLEARFILVRSEQTKDAIEGRPVNKELDIRYAHALNAIMSHQVEHAGCDPS